MRRDANRPRATLSTSSISYVSPARSNTYSTASPPSAAADAPAARPTRHAYVTAPPAARAAAAARDGEATVRTVTLCGSTRCAYRPPSAASSVCRGSGAYPAVRATKPSSPPAGAAVATEERSASPRNIAGAPAAPCLSGGGSCTTAATSSDKLTKGHQLRGERGSGRGEVAGRAAAPYIGAGAIFRAPGVY